MKKLLKFLHRCLSGLIKIFRHKKVDEINEKLHELSECEEEHEKE